jgi:hypothetical protein
MDDKKKSSHNPRRSLSGVFQGLSIQDELRKAQIPLSRDAKKPAQQPSGNETRKSKWSVHGSWPNWTTISRGTKAPVQGVQFTLRLEPGVLNYTKDPQDTALQSAFNDAVDHITEVQAIVKNSLGVDGALDNALEELMIQVIYGSNLIEKIEHGLDETIKLCREVFSGKFLNAENIPPR